MKNITNQIRIIAGKWRSRKITFPDATGLRPTPDRVRETLFNWLAPIIANSSCLDLFAGSGALGFEALSRGALTVTMIDNSLVVIKNLNYQKQIFEADNLEIVLQDAINYLKVAHKKFDIVFLDPPFHQNLIASCSEALQASGLLNKEAYIYIEAEATLQDLRVPKDWQLLKYKMAGQVKYYLFMRNDNDTP